MFEYKLVNNTPLSESADKHLCGSCMLKTDFFMMRLIFLFIFNVANLKSILEVFVL